MQVIEIIVLLVTFIIAELALTHSKWSASREFLLQVDSDEMRKARLVVYKYLDAGGKIEDVGYVKNYKNLKFKKKRMKNVESALTKVIAFYDGNAALLLKGYIHKDLFDGTTLLTAARFYDKVSGYINSRRNDTTRSDNNKIYAQYYSELMSSKCVNKKMKRIVGKINDYSYEEVFKTAHKNVSLFAERIP